MIIKPKTFRAITDISVGTDTYAVGDVVPSGPNLDRLIAYGFVAADESKTTPNDPKKEGSDNAAG